MENYKISQTPGGGGKSGKTGKPNRKVVVPKQRQTKSIDSQQLLIAGLAAVVLIGGGVFLTLRLGKKSPAAGSNAAGNSKKAGSGAGIPGPVFTSVSDAVSNKQPAALNKYYAKRVHVVIRGRNFDQTVNASQVEGLVGSLINGAQTPWDWHVSATQLAAWQAGPYGQYFTGDVIVGISSDGLVISIGVDGSGQITTVFVAPSSTLTTTSTTGGSTTGSSTTTSGTTTSGGSTSSSTTGVNQDAD